uniref:GPI alpha-1,4-mannosyltransferase I, catalytic subunit n=1 Tax=Globodera pallida TaxID=36090 RepID=A0A183CNY7_GLOPA
KVHLKTFVWGSLYHSKALENNRRSTIRSAVLWWLFNPFTATISARGSSDAMICALILFTLFLLVKCHDKLEQYFLLLSVAAIVHGAGATHFRIFPELKQIKNCFAAVCGAEGWMHFAKMSKYDEAETRFVQAMENSQRIVRKAHLHEYFLLLSVAAIVHGAGATHFRIFPLIYLPSIFLSIARTKSGCQQTTRFNGFKSFIWMCATNFRGFSFISLSLASFALSVAAFFALYGQPFVHAAFVYHLSRADIQHNFSPYFLPLYFAFALRYSEDLPFCWFLTTFAFVSFNKVCTSQYFVWYLCFLPLLFTRLTFRWQHAAKLLVLWLLGQAFWLFPAYLLEFRGMPTFTWTWLASLTFLGINIFLIIQFVQHYASPSFSRRLTIERREMTKIQ